MRPLLISASVVLVLLFGASAALAQAVEAPIWTGLFTDEQAERGKANFAQSCVRCHGADLAGVTAPSLNGDRFIAAWENENLYKLFTKVRDTMPPNFGTILTDDAKLDVITYILRTNGFPTGSNELKVEPDTLEGIPLGTASREAPRLAPLGSPSFDLQRRQRASHVGREGRVVQRQDTVGLQAAPMGGPRHEREQVRRQRLAADLVFVGVGVIEGVLVSVLVGQTPGHGVGVSDGVGVCVCVGDSVGVGVGGTSTSTDPL